MDEGPALVHVSFSPKDPDVMQNLGFGLGLRPDHYEAILSDRPSVDFFEALTENYLVPGGKPLHYLDRIRAEYPLVLHGVSLSIGSTEPIDRNYLEALKALMQRVEPAWVSDHLCWTGAGGINLHDLMPLPYTCEALQHLVPRIREVQDFLGERILLENVSSYVAYEASDMSEWEFLAQLSREADCLLLLDVNNVYVNSVNHHFDPDEFIRGIPVDRVAQIHLAGHERQETFIIDTHDAPIVDAVWALYRRTRERLGAVSTMIERDANIPPLPELLAELDIARGPTNAEAAA
jgi:uncharacterized protein (UPF0276 family)